MARARLLGHVQTLRVHPIDRSTTVWNENAGEPFAGTQEADPVLIPVQLEWDAAGGRAPGQGGARVRALAVAVALARDARRCDWTPTDGDRISAVIEPDGCEEAVNLYVAGARRKAKTHYGAETWRIVLSDRSPAREPTTASGP